MNTYCNSIRSIPMRNAPFDGHLIDATILVGLRSNCGQSNSADILRCNDRSVYRNFPGFAPLHSEYWSKRGLRLKQASFFMGSNRDITTHNATRFVKKPSKLTSLSVQADHPESALLIPLKGMPNLHTLVELERRMKKAKNNPSDNKSVLNWFRNRPDYWERHPPAPKAPILFNYFFRTRPRHIYNPHKLHYADNYYGVYPENCLPNAAAFALLNATSTVVELQAISRRQGNGLQKLQLFEYRDAWVPSAKLFSNEQIGHLNYLGLELATKSTININTVTQIDHVIYTATGSHPNLDPKQLITIANDFWSSN